MSFERFDTFATGSVPNSYRFIITIIFPTSRGNIFSVGGIAYGTNTLSMPFERIDTFAAISVPDSDCFIPASRNDIVSVGGITHGIDIARMPFERVQEFSCREVQNFNIVSR